MRKAVATLLVLCALSFTPVSSEAADTWTFYTSLPSPTEGMYGGTYGNVIIAAYGHSGVDTNTTRLYTVKGVNTDTWSTGADAPLPERAEGAGVVRSKYFYAIGGRSGGGVLKDLERYEIPANTWLPLGLRDMPTARAGLAAAVLGSDIYAIGGRSSPDGPCSGPAMAKVERYNVATDEWEEVAPLPSPRSDLAAIALGGKIYVFGGCDGASIFDEVDVYDPDGGPLGAWTPLTPMPTARASLVVGRIKDTIYAIGGTSNLTDSLQTNEAFDPSPAPGAWTTALDMPTGRGEAIAASRKDRNGANAIFVIGGGLPAFGIETDANEAFTE